MTIYTNQLPKPGGAKSYKLLTIIFDSLYIKQNCTYNVKQFFNDINMLTKYNKQHKFGPQKCTIRIKTVITVQ